MNMQVLKHAPNFLTSLNVLCGTLATFLALNGMVDKAIWFIFIGALFDFSDGFAARALKAYSEMGKELDSLADLISFGMAPASIWSAIIRLKIMGSFSVPFSEMQTPEQFWIVSPFILVIFSALRLAKFNVDTRQTENFLGLTTTATGIFTASFAYMFLNKPEWFGWLNPIIILILIFIFSLLLVSEISMFSLKFKNLKWSDNKERFILLGFALISIALLGLGGIAATILYYIIVSIIKWLLGSKS
ncbi:CDP-alcohol phosphatidyltransferase family protein [Carboxylicivirga linearis]|uniref:CDP-alcohol phosphatidyltransferase family protein n=2 Tax=Carboxylicivirga linearis TaxID=1628157 RepID=A0ABS5JQM8_9BACT|nr:CDP-alcohol phosphatidyltransferase family protein [Carboxylicivirga linearis]